ncbi:MAG TPA: hypothetical protein VLY82_06825 [Nitrososphaerales archaeon]|nr:hypothetical protein [Nitrososphaerales archaeon]
MSIGAREARSFFAPLKGRTATFLLENRLANLDFARSIIGLLGHTPDTAEILDLDAFYTSNAENVFGSLNSPTVATLRVPEPGADIEGEFAAMFESSQGVVVVDSLNSFFHLISQDDGSSRGRKLNFAIEALAYLARTNAKAVILSMYRREGLTRWGTGRSISDLSDITASVYTRGHDLLIRAERGLGWEGGVFSTRIPSE